MSALRSATRSFRGTGNYEHKTDVSHKNDIVSLKSRAVRPQPQPQSAEAIEYFGILGQLLSRRDRTGCRNLGLFCEVPYPLKRVGDSRKASTWLLKRALR